jgi:probable 2-oxoglutarate dehydrogenase E1 component DHKTD1
MSLLLRASRMVMGAHRRVLLSTPSQIASLQSIRHYRDDGVHGYRVASEYQIPDYSEKELANRNANSNLLRLVLAYRNHGHRAADLDPLGIQEKLYVLGVYA